MIFSGPDGVGTFKSFSWVGLAPGTVGVFQMNFQMPAKVVNGRNVVFVSRAYEVVEALRVRLININSKSAALYVSE